MTSVKISDAALSNDLEKVKMFVEKNDFRKYGRELVYIATKEGHLDMLKYLAEKDKFFSFRFLYYNVHHLTHDGAQDADGPCTLLDIAVAKGHLEIVKYLVEDRNKNIYHVFHSRYTAVNWAIVHGHLNILKYFIEERGVDVNLKLRGIPLTFVRPILFDAVEYEHHDIIAYLIEEKKANLTAIDGPRENILYMAVRKGNLNFIKYILDGRKAKIDMEWTNWRGYTLVHQIMTKFKLKNAEEILRYLIDEKHANVDIPCHTTFPDSFSGMTPLQYATKYLSVKIVEYLIDCGANINKQDRNGRTALHFALSRNLTTGFEICKLLCKHGADINHKNKRGETPLDFAMVKADGINVCKLLIEHGANPNSTDIRGNKAVHVAAMQNTVHLLDYLVCDKKIDVNTPRETDKSTPLLCAAFVKQLENCKYLIEHGARLDQKNANNKTPLDIAMQRLLQEQEFDKKFEAYKIFIDHSADYCDKEGNKLVHIATIWDKITFLDYLVRDKRADINSERKTDNWTPLHCAASKNHFKICKYLFKHGAQIDKKDKEGKTPFNIALTRLSKEDKPGRNKENTTAVGICKLFMKHGANVNLTDKTGNRVVHIAAMQNRIHFLDYLVSNKQVDVNTPRETDKWTPLHCAAFRNHFEMCEYLVEHGARVDHKNSDNKTVLDIVLERLSEEDEFVRKQKNRHTIKLCKLFLEHGGNVNSTDNEGNQLVHIAAIQNNLRFLDYLVLDKKVDINVPRKADNWSPLHCAASLNHFDICIYLVGHGANPRAESKCGKTPAELTSDQELIDYLKNALTTRRVRRNVVNHFLAHSQNLINQRNARNVNRSAMRFSGYDFSLRLRHFLLFFSLVIRYYLEDSINLLQTRGTIAGALLQGTMHPMLNNLNDYSSNFTNPE